MPWPKGKPFSELQRKRISDAMKVRVLSEDHKRKIGLKSKGRHPTEEQKLRQSLLMKGRPSKLKGIPKTEEHKRKISEWRTGRPNLALLGVPKTEAHKEKLKQYAKNRPKETLQKMRDAKLGKPLSEEHRAKIGLAHQGEKSSFWKGGISFEPYCPKFNQEVMRRVRLFYNNTCVVCGKTKEENKGKNMSVHHVHYDKQTCCNDSPHSFVTLCVPCHTKTTHSKERTKWEQQFATIIEKNKGKCYYTKEEYFKKIGGVL